MPMTDQTQVRQEYARLAGLPDLPPAEEPDAVLDGIARLAARICGVPMGMVTFLGPDHVNIRAGYGIDIASTPRSESFCHYAVQLPGAMVIEDARQDARFAGISHVTGSPGVRFYAGAPIRDAAGHGLGAVCVLDTEPRHPEPFQLAALEALAEEVKARLEARASLAAQVESERIHREFFATSPQAMWLIDALTWRFLDVNDAAINTYGWTREEFLGKRLHDLWIAEDAADKTARCGGTIAPHLSATLTRHRRRDGSIVVAEATGHECVSGGRRAYLVTLTDLGAREGAAARLIESNRRFGEAQRLARVGHWEADLNTGDLVASDELHRILGLPAGSMHHAAQFRSLIHPEDVDAAFARRYAAEQAGVPFDIEHRIVRPDGTVRWVHVRADVRRGETPQDDRYVGIMQDISDRRAPETEADAA